MNIRFFHRWLGKSLPRKKGQMAIFLALIFQVLFVFFSMSINIALMVHDKINLQNAVDLAAYYAAQKQAEILNVIAHQNYQIRQAWKLLVWRYRVVGALGVENHPVRGGINNDTLFLPSGLEQQSHPHPAICMVHKYNASTSREENLCKRLDQSIPPLPEIPIILPSPFNMNLVRLRDRYQRYLEGFCESYGAYNWWFALLILTSYRYEQMERKKLIRDLAQNLKRNHFKDLQGDSVFEGIKKVFRKNLSFSNAMAFDENPNNLVFYNSLNGIGRKKWLPDVLISPTLPYIDPVEGLSCDNTVSLISSKPKRAKAKEAAGRLQAYELWNVAKGEPRNLDNPLHMSLGVEKNPWYVSFVGVKASTKPRQLFWPIGPTLSLKARAFAKPFGGRIGPWYSHLWPPSSPHSSGSPVDALVPPRILSLGSGQHSNSLADQVRRFPNYSRYPGDKLGLMSRLALVGAASPRSWDRFHFKYDYFFTIASFSSHDRLAWDLNVNRPINYRSYEIAALSPDLFDMTFYSIALNGDIYYRALESNRSKIGFPHDLVIKGDLGSRHSHRTYNIKQQILLHQRKNPHAYWFALKPEHLLTSWSSRNQAIDYTFPEERFGQCARFDDGLLRVPNSCIARGGRSGYSVKLVSRSALRYGQFKLGGRGQGGGPVANPPPEDF